MTTTTTTTTTSARLIDTICLFDVDGTITMPRQLISKEMDEYLQEIRKKCLIGLVGGSDIGKIAEQIGGVQAINKYDYVFSENGLVAYKHGQLFFEENIQKSIGEENLQEFLNYCLKYLSEIRLPFKRGTFIEFRNGLINVSPVGRNCSKEERDQFESYDQKHQIRRDMVENLKKRFSHLNLVFSIGGQISFDVFPHGWDKRYALKHLEKDQIRKVYFFGDKTFEGGNDYEIYSDDRTEGYSVKNPDETKKYLQELFP